MGMTSPITYRSWVMVQLRITTVLLWGLDRTGYLGSVFFYAAQIVFNGNAKSLAGLLESAPQLILLWHSQWMTCGCLFVCWRSSAHISCTQVEMREGKPITHTHTHIPASLNMFVWPLGKKWQPVILSGLKDSLVTHPSLQRWWASLTLSGAMLAGLFPSDVW